MCINVLRHTPDEGSGSIRTWADQHRCDFHIYHPETFGKLPAVEETDLLIILDGPMSLNDDLIWIKQERKLIKAMLDAHRPMFGACLGGQQIVKTVGIRILDAPHKEVGWAPVHLKGQTISNILKKLIALHWHQQMFEIPEGAKLLFSSDLVKNQGFLFGDNVIGLQFHFEPEEDNMKEIAINDADYPLENNDLYQTGKEIIAHRVPEENQKVMFKLLDFITK